VCACVRVCGRVYGRMGGSVNVDTTCTVGER
jgi:hypothetical protein